MKRWRQPYQGSRVLKSIPILWLVAALAGCHNRTAQPVDEQARQAFTRDMMQVLQRGIRHADTGAQVGAVSLKITLDRQSAPIGCEATRARAKHRLLLPSDVPTTDFQALARLVEAQCWKNIYPLVPPTMVDDDGITEIVVPMILMLPKELQAPGTPRRQANAQRDYFWQHLLRDQQVNSIGGSRCTTRRMPKARSRAAWCDFTRIPCAWPSSDWMASCRPVSTIAAWRSI